jgi:hypothetical protein
VAPALTNLIHEELTSEPYAARLHLCAVADYRQPCRRGLDLATYAIGTEQFKSLLKGFLARLVGEEGCVAFLGRGASRQGCSPKSPPAWL